MMKRTLTVFSLALAIGCSSSQKKEDPVVTETTEQPVKEETKPMLEETEGCSVEVDTAVADQAHRDYAMNTSGETRDAQQRFRGDCSSAIPVKMNWGHVFASAGFDKDESEATVAQVWSNFLGPVTRLCAAHHDKFRESVTSVVITATDQPDRIGMCLDDEGALVYRFHLEQESQNSSAMSADEMEAWFGENMQ